MNKPEPEHKGPWWAHPYALYVWATVGLFAFLIVMGWLAVSNGWIPERGALP